MYTREIGNLKIHVNCVADPEKNYEAHYDEIKAAIAASGYVPEYGMENLIQKVVLMFDCDDNYGEYDESTGMGGYGNEFTISGLLEYVRDNGGWKEFDWIE